MERHFPIWTRWRTVGEMLTAGKSRRWERVAFAPSFVWEGRSSRRRKTCSHPPTLPTTPLSSGSGFNEKSLPIKRRRENTFKRTENQSTFGVLTMNRKHFRVFSRGLFDLVVVSVLCTLSAVVCALHSLKGLALHLNPSRSRLVVL